MGTLSENVIRNNLAWDLIKNALKNKNTGIADNIPVEQYVDYIELLDALKRYITEYNIFGNSIQGAIPSIDNPIEINSVGKKEGKLIIQSGVHITEIELDEPLRGQGNSKDNLDYKNRITITFDGTEAWVRQVTNISGIYRWYTPIMEKIKKASASNNVENILCNRFVKTTADATYLTTQNGIAVNVTGSIVIYHENISRFTLAEFKELLKQWNSEGKPLVVECTLAEPIPQNIIIPQIPYFGVSPKLLNEIQGEIRYTV